MTTNTYQPHQDQNDPGNEPQMNNEFNNDWIQGSDKIIPESYLFYTDPAILNPDELATFPKQATVDNLHHHHHESHLVNNKRTPVRDGRNITRTDNHPDKKGFM